MRTFTLDERTAISQAFSRGNYANAYETNDLDECEIDDMPDHEHAAFVLGFFSSCSLDEIGSDRDTFDECYWSDAGRAVIAAGYCDDRADEYQADLAFA